MEQFEDGLEMQITDTRSFECKLHGNNAKK